MAAPQPAIPLRWDIIIKPVIWNKKNKTSIHVQNSIQQIMLF
jgi:hypothetical protein